MPSSEDDFWLVDNSKNSPDDRRRESDRRVSNIATETDEFDSLHEVNNLIDTLDPLDSRSDLDPLSNNTQNLHYNPSSMPHRSPEAATFGAAPHETMSHSFTNRANPFASTNDDPFADEPEIELQSLHDVSDVEQGPDDDDTSPIGVMRQEQSRDFDIRHIWQRILRRTPTDMASSTAAPREIRIFDRAHSKRFKSNYVSTTKYNVATFLPKFLFEQFSKTANLFFLATACIQQIPHVSPTNRYTTIGTLLVVFIVSATKELVEDWKRWKGDKELNNSKIAVLSQQGHWNEIRWATLRVGDIVRVHKEQYLPADTVVLSTSEPSGLCYIETANLDGETNLKIKQAPQNTQHLTRETALLDELSEGIVQSEHPNSSLYTYEGTLKPARSPPVSLGVEQMLLRGTSLRNTNWIIGCVVFTGHETKLMRNATATPIKRTAVEHMMDLQIVFLFFILLALAIMSSLGNVIKFVQWRGPMWYLDLGSTSAGKTFILDVFTYWILFSNLVPISLFVTIDVIKYWHGFLISNDLDMYDSALDQPAVCRTSALVEELGQIKHVFSDKTGTLTRNVMEFKACCIGGQVFATEVPEEKQGEYIKFSSLDFAGGEAEHLAFLTALATCHTVIPEVLDSGEIEYQASSPDEGALVEGAAALGVKFVSRTPRGLTIETPQGPQTFELLDVCEFNSTRKRMSTVLRGPDGKIRVVTKGADTVIFERLAEPHQEAEVTAALEDFASIGLRTLVLAQREVSENEYQTWAKRYHEASISLVNRSERVAEVANEIEHDLQILGVSAIEDKLQNGVSETITALQDAGIKIWVLTGDRQETAINIGMSSKLLSEDMSLLLINETNLAATSANMRAKLAALDDASSSENVSEFDSLALVIDGHTLDYALDEHCAKEFLRLCCLCKAVICCRVSPLQKALVVKLAKRELKDLLLAIGDGANDVSMIQAAHVGVGIAGMEGQQAARSADVSIAQFRFLRKLLLVHGLWSYNRLSRAILYSFYKNIALYLTQFWYVFYNGFSGESLYESWTVSFYNIFSTVMPPFAIGILDQFVSAKLILRYPQIYRLGQKGAFLNIQQFWEWIANGIYHSMIIFWFGVGMYLIGNILSNGDIANQWAWGAAMYTSCVFTVLGKAALITNVWSTYTVIAIPCSAALWLVGYPLYAEIGPRVHVGAENSGVIPALYPSAAFWALIFLTPGACLIRDVAWKYWRRMYVPEYYHYVQEIQKYKIQDRRPQMDQFQKAIRKVRQVSRMRKQRGFAFSASDEGSERVVRAYNTGKT